MAHRPLMESFQSVSYTHLDVYKRQIENIFKKLNSTKIGASSSEASLFERLFNYVSNETIHDQRVGIPESFIGYAALGTEVIWAETDTHVQLWQPARFAQKIAQAQQT